MKNPVILLLLLFPLLAAAQTNSKFGRTHHNALPENFKLSANSLREHIYNGIPQKLTEELSTRACYRFADQSAVQLSMLFSSGNVYSDWPQFENYVNKVLKRVIPEELAHDTVIHAYLVKDGTMNAFMTPSGIMFVHIGMFDGLPTESALAGTLTHELAHYYLRHSLKGFAKQEHNEFERVFNKSSASRFSVENEMQADSLALIWMSRSGYGYGGLQKAIDMNRRMENSYLLEMQNVWELPERTHPGSDRRLAQIDSFALKNPDLAGSDFLVGKELFYTFREFAKPEILDCLLRDFNFDACIEKAFKFHLISPNRKEIVYYLMEGIRRKCYLNTDYWKKNFITEKYFKIVETKGGHRKDKAEGSIFRENYKDILGISPEESENIQATFYWEGPERFITYEEAFDFFASLGDVLKYPECTLSNALSYSSKPEQRNKLLEQYLSYPDIRHREFATQLLSGAIYSSLSAGTLTLLHDFYAIVRQGKEEIYIRNEKMVGDNLLTPYFEAAVTGFEKRRYRNLSELQETNIDDYSLLQELHHLVWIMIRAKGEKTELSYIDPRYWEIMHRYGVNEIEFIDFKYTDSRKYEYTLETYKEAAAVDIDALLSDVKRYRYLNIRVGVIRIMAGSEMKIRHYGQEKKVEYNKPAKDEIVGYINENLKLRDKIVSQADEIKSAVEPNIIIEYSGHHR